jgi:hypothetical protein
LIESAEHNNKSLSDVCWNLVKEMSTWCLTEMQTSKSSEIWLELYGTPEHKNRQKVSYQLNINDEAAVARIESSAYLGKH